MKPVTTAIIGAGERGRHTYAPYALGCPDEMRIVAVAEPVAEKRAAFQAEYGLPDSACYGGYETFFENPVRADCALVCTQDQMHVAPATLAMRQGYHVLLEKPMAVNEADCRALVRTAQETDRYLMVCHVLRYTPFYSTLKSMLDDGAIGRLLTVQHTEGIANWHFAHSFVRGNWGVAERSAPMILAKCCHDLDLLQWLVGSRCQTVSSDGALTHFRESGAPRGAPARCLDGCPAARECLYFAPDLYLTENTGWPASVISVDPSYAARRAALQTGPYGRCVFHCDNDVCDHQSVNLWFENDVGVQMTATAFSTDINRRTTLTGTKGELACDFRNAAIIRREHGSGREDVIRLEASDRLHGHGGGDWRLLRDFLDLVRSGHGQARTLAADALTGHLMAFAAEASRRDGKTVRL